MIFPKKTEFNRRIPKQKFYENLDLSPQIKKAFVDQIQTITWKNKLSADTCNFLAGTEVPEFEVFRIELRIEKLDEGVFRVLDSQIPYHILYELAFDGKVQYWIRHINLTNADLGKPKTVTYFHSPWMGEDNVNIELRGFTLDDVWNGLIAQIGSVQIEDGKTLDEQIQANAERDKLEKEITRLEKLARKESQPKKKFELVQKINELRKKVQDA